MRRVVPLQIETPPAGLEERVEADIEVIGRGGDLPRRVDRERLVADRLPVGAQRLEFRKPRRLDIRARLDWRQQIAPDVDRREKGRVIGQLTLEPEALCAAIEHIDRADDEPCKDNPSHRRSSNFFLMELSKSLARMRIEYGHVREPQAQGGSACATHGTSRQT
jgi:hypothetical protein